MHINAKKKRGKKVIFGWPDGARDVTTDYAELKNKELILGPWCCSNSTM